jgi:Protein of unknown function (DUF4232)
VNLKRHRHRPLLAVVPLLALSAGVSAASSVHVTGCAGSQLSAKLKVIRGSAGAGHVSYALRLTNNGRKTCALGNHVALRLLKANGRSLPTHVVDVDASETSTIAHGRSLGAELRFSPDIPSGGEPQRGACEPAAHKVRVRLVAPGSGTVVAVLNPPTSVCGHGLIQQQGLD